MVGIFSIFLKLFTSTPLTDFDAKMNDIDIADINDSGISLNDYEAMTLSRANSDTARDTPTSSGFHDNRRGNAEKSVRFEQIETDSNKIGEYSKKHAENITNISNIDNVMFCFSLY